MIEHWYEYLPAAWFIPPGTYPPHRECDNHPRNRFHPRLLVWEKEKIRKEREI